MKALPEILLQDLAQIPGFDKELFIEAHQSLPVTSIRLNPAKPGSLYTGNAEVPWCPEGRYLADRPLFTVDPLYHAGAYYVQEASSMFLNHMFRQLLPERNNIRVLDLCAAPGGKSTLIASLLDAGSLLVSNEVIRTRASVLEENMTRWGHMNTWVISNDPKDIGKLERYFDVIIVDAPCSGSGLFRKDERALTDWTEANVNLCSQRQQRILADVWPALKQNAILIYATCSYSTAEDEHIVDWMGDSFEAETLRVDIPAAWGITETITPENQFCGYRFFPYKTQGEGFYISAVRKTSEQKILKTPRFKLANDSKAKEQCRHLLESNNWLCLPENNEYIAIHPAHETDLNILQQHTYLRKTGLKLGSPVKNDWIPAHDIALSIDKAKGLSSIETTKEQALKFLKREEFILDGLQKGWYVVTYNGLGLGWIKALGNRINNYLPKHWRIRMEINDTYWT